MNISLATWKRENELPDETSAAIDTIFDPPYPCSYQPLARSSEDETVIETVIVPEFIYDDIKARLADLHQLDVADLKLTDHIACIRRESAVKSHNIQTFTQISEESAVFLRQKQHIENIILEIDSAQQYYISDQDYFNKINFLNEFKGIAGFYEAPDKLLRLCQNTRASIEYFSSRPGYRDADVQLHRNMNIELRAQHIIKELFVEYHNLQLARGLEAVKTLRMLNLSKSCLLASHIQIEQHQLDSLLLIVLFLNDPSTAKIVKPELISRLFDNKQLSPEMVAMKDGLYKIYITLELNNVLSEKLEQAFDFLLTSARNRVYIDELKEYFGCLLYKLNAKILDVYATKTSSYEDLFGFYYVVVHVLLVGFSNRFKDGHELNDTIGKHVAALTTYSDKLLQQKVRTTDMEHLFNTVAFIKKVMQISKLPEYSDSDSLVNSSATNMFLEYIKHQYNVLANSEFLEMLGFNISKAVREILQTQLSFLTILLNKVKLQELIHKNPNFEVKNYSSYNLIDTTNKEISSASYTLLSYIHNKLNQLGVISEYSEFLEETTILATKRLLAASEVFKNENNGFLFVYKNLFMLNQLVNPRASDFQNQYIFEPVLIADGQLALYIEEVLSMYQNMSFEMVPWISLKILLSYQIIRMSRYYALLLRTSTQDKFLAELEKEIEAFYLSAKAFLNDTAFGTFTQIFSPYFYTSLLGEIAKTGVEMDRNVLSSIFEITHK